MAQQSTRMAKPVQVKNRSAAAIQITAEQIVLEARDRAMAAAPPPPKRHIADVAELREHRTSVRKDFEAKIKFNKNNLGTWLRYAKWEEEQHEIERARSIFERALEINYQHVPTWLRYAEMEMRAKFPNRARNLYDRAITLLPRVSALWYKYTWLEEMLGNTANARAIFNRWMEWEPGKEAWQAFINFEQRTGDNDKARAAWERFLACHPSQHAYLKLARWEFKNGQKALARRVYERALEELRDDEKTETLYLSFAQFEEMCGELERARVVLKFGLDLYASSSSSSSSSSSGSSALASSSSSSSSPAAYAALYQAHVTFEKKHGDRKAIDSVVLTKRRQQYEDSLRAQPLNYDAWFDYLRLEENSEEQGEGEVDVVSSRSRQ